MSVPSNHPDDIKAFVVTTLEKFNTKINEDIETKVIIPVGNLVTKVKEINRKVTELESSVSKKDQTEPKPTSDDPAVAAFSYDSIVDASVNFIPTHVEESMRFVVSILQMIDGKKEPTPKDIFDFIIQSYGKVSGPRLIASFTNVVRDSKRKKLKDAWDEVVKLATP